MSSVGVRHFLSRGAATRLGRQRKAAPVTGSNLRLVLCRHLLCCITLLELQLQRMLVRAGGHARDARASVGGALGWGPPPQSDICHGPFVDGTLEVSGAFQAFNTTDTTITMGQALPQHRGIWRPPDLKVSESIFPTHVEIIQMYVGIAQPGRPPDCGGLAPASSRRPLSSLADLAREHIVLYYTILH